MARPFSSRCGEVPVPLMAAFLCKLWSACNEMEDLSRFLERRRCVEARLEAYKRCATVPTAGCRSPAGCRCISACGDFRGVVRANALSCWRGNAVLAKRKQPEALKRRKEQRRGGLLLLRWALYALERGWHAQNKSGCSDWWHSAEASRAGQGKSQGQVSTLAK